mmetsp:Transcript_5717/g.9020  ORF Transcript_5717/g.9020 Transcript_5717/m.9020 type:complete len:389 (-) Transcript_5717:159-1325(-)
MQSKHGRESTVPTPYMSRLQGLGGSSEIDLGTPKLSSQVVHVSCQEDGSGEENTDGDRGSLGFSCCRCSDDSVFTNDLDSINVCAGGLVRVVDAHLGFALSSDFVDSVAHFVDFSVSTTAHAVQADHRLFRVRQFHTIVVQLEHFCTFVGEDRASVVQEDSEADLSTLLSTVGTDVVGNIVVVITCVGSVVVVVVGQLTVVVVVTLVHLGTLHVVVEVDVVFVLVLVLAIGKLTLTVVVCGLTTVHVLVLHLVQVGTNEGFHVNDVVSVVAVASKGGSSGARALGTETESDKTLSHDLDIVLAVGIFVPLLDVVASLELDAVSGEVTGIDVVPVNLLVVALVLIAILVVVIVVGELTGVLQQSVADGRFRRNVDIVTVDHSSTNRGDH